MNPVVDFQAHGSLTLERFQVEQLRLGVKEEFMPLTRRRFRNQRFRPYPGYETQRPFEDKPRQEKNSLAVERTKEVVDKFKESDELMLRIRREELDQEWKAAGGKWWELKQNPDDEIAEDHYYDLVRLFNVELHQKYWEKEDWFYLWDHATSDHGYLPIEW